MERLVDESRAQAPEREDRDPDAQQIEEHDRHHEVGSAGQKDGKSDSHAIEPAPAPRSSERTEGHTDQQRQCQSDRVEHDGDRQALPDLAADRLAGEYRGTEIAVHNLIHPGAVLAGKRSVQVVTGPDGVHGGGVCRVFTDQGCDRAPGDHVHEQEDDNRDQKDERHKQEQPPDGIGSKPLGSPHADNSGPATTARSRCRNDAPGGPEKTPRGTTPFNSTGPL